MVLCNLGSDHEFTLAKAQVDRGEPYDFNLPWKDKEEVKRKEMEAASKVGCEGETLLGAWQYLYRFGVPEESCITYDEKGDDQVDLGNYIKGNSIPTCIELKGDNYDKCPTTGGWLQYHMSTGYYHVPGTQSTDKDAEPGNEENIRRDIFHWGPATTGFTIYADFMAWDGHGVYKWDGKSKEEGGHAVVIMGWGIDAAAGPYWIVRNSWGDYWGENGYFKIQRGTNMCSIEENIVVGLPNLHGFRLYLEWPMLYRTEDLMLRALWGVRSSGYKTTTIEQMIVGKISGEKTEIYKQQYDPNAWPDVSVFVAGDPRMLHFRLAETTDPTRYPIRYLKLHKEFAVGFSVATVGFGVLLLYFMNKKKN
jgi:hypothetical protein